MFRRSVPRNRVQNQSEKSFRGRLQSGWRRWRGSMVPDKELYRYAQGVGAGGTRRRGVCLHRGRGRYPTRWLSEDGGHELQSSACPFMTARDNLEGSPFQKTAGLSYFW